MLTKVQIKNSDKSIFLNIPFKLVGKNGKVFENKKYVIEKENDLEVLKVCSTSSKIIMSTSFLDFIKDLVREKVLEVQYDKEVLAEKEEEEEEEEKLVNAAYTLLKKTGVLSVVDNLNCIYVSVLTGESYGVNYNYLVLEVWEYNSVNDSNGFRLFEIKLPVPIDDNYQMHTREGYKIRKASILLRNWLIKAYIPNVSYCFSRFPFRKELEELIEISA